MFSGQNKETYDQFNKLILDNESTYIEASDYIKTGEFQTYPYKLINKNRTSNDRWVTKS